RGGRTPASAYANRRAPGGSPRPTCASTATRGPRTPTKVAAVTFWERASRRKGMNSGRIGQDDDEQEERHDESGSGNHDLTRRLHHRSERRAGERLGRWR